MPLWWLRLSWLWLARLQVRRMWWLRLLPALGTVPLVLARDPEKHALGLDTTGVQRFSGQIMRKQ